MRDILEDIFGDEPLDPRQVARASLRPKTRGRFYKSASVGEGAPFAVLLDGRPVKTPAKNALAAPTQPLAQAIGAEWDAQRERIDPATMPLTRIANSIIDGVVPAPQSVAEDLAKYLGSDLLCYRAGTPDGLVQRQTEHWDPILTWARTVLGARFVLSEGIVFVTQPEGAIAAARAAIPADPWRLGAAHVVTTLTGSALIALALCAGEIGRDAAWVAANVDEDWNMQLWGRDEMALAARSVRFADLQAAATVLAMTA
jgi:chaperone required for assembly of F1-ATPase